MPADIDVLRGSHINFSSSYNSYNEPLKRDTSSTLRFSPPQFGVSPPTHFTFHGRCSSPTLLPVPNTLAKSLNNLRLNSNIDYSSKMPVAMPRRPCLVVRCDEQLHPDHLDPPSPNRHKKKVVFADDRGYSLTQVRTMTEPSNMPPRWSFQFLAHVTQGACVEITTEPWEITFQQPASDYLDFRRRLDTNNVSLENVIVKETEEAVVGTLKVRNLAYHKEVFVRTTTDDWETHEDAYCKYVVNTPAANGVTVLYDTFSFRLTLPKHSNNLQFCVCYRCEGFEYWDNNGGTNYTVVKKILDVPKVSSDNLILGHLERPLDTKICIQGQFYDGKSIQIDTWSEFASWNHLDTDTPYW